MLSARWRRVTPQSVEEVQAIQDAHAFVLLAQGLQVRIISHQVSGATSNSAGDDYVVVGIIGNAADEVIGGKRDMVQY